MDLLRRFHWGLACLLAAGAIVMPAQRARAQSTPPAAATSADPPASGSVMPPYFVILGGPADFDALLQKIGRPDLEVRAFDRPGAAAGGAAQADAADAADPWIVESVRVRGVVRGDSAALRVELGIVIAAVGPTWVPIRLDGQRLVDAREGRRSLGLRMMPGGRWQVGLAGRGPHRFEVELRCPLVTRPARTSMSLAIPEAPSTAVELDFDRRRPDLIIGTNEAYGQSDLPGGRGARLSTHLSPRSRLEVSWATGPGPGDPDPPLLTAQGDIAIDIDSEQMRTRSSWVIRCVRGMTRTLEVGMLDDRDEVTELRLDDQDPGAGIEGGRGAGRLTIPLPEPMRPGSAEHRLILKTRRPYTRGAGHPIRFRGFPIVHAREQSGAIGVTQSATLWVAPTSAEGLRRIVPTFLPKELAERPGTSLAFEFLEQPFALGLDVESSPPLVGSQSQTRFRLEGDRAHSRAKIDLHWVRGRPFEVELALGPGLEVTSVGPPSVVEAWNLTGPAAPRGASAPAAAVDAPRGLTIRLAPAVRDQSRVTLDLEGSQRLPREGPVELGLFVPEAATAGSAWFGVDVDRSLTAALDEEAARAGGPDAPTFRPADPVPGRPIAPGGEAGGRTLSLQAGGNPRVLPLRIARHARSVRHETIVSAEVSRRWVDLLQKTTLAVRHGTLDAPTIRVPAAVADDWEVRQPEVIDREELVREPDGSRLYRLRPDRPLAEGSALEFRWRLPLDRPLETTEDRRVEVPWIGFPDATDGSTRFELAPRPGVVVRQVDPSWVPAADAGLAASGGRSFLEGTDGKGRPFGFRAIALEPVALPALLVPRLLIRTRLGQDETARHRAWFWAEAHGATFPFELPEGARILAARVDGRAADRVELEGTGVASRRYRLALPADAASRPALVELEYQSSADGGWSAPRLLDDGLVLQTRWEVTLPWERTLLGVPPGWSDENQWYWDGRLWLRRPARDGAALIHWVLGENAPTTAEAWRETAPDESQNLLFGRTTGRPGEPAELDALIVSRSWLVATGSGATLLAGFLAIFSRIRFRTAWAIVAALALLAAAALQPSLALQLAQSSLMGAALTSLGVLIQYLMDRRRSPSRPGREPPSGLGPARSDSSMNRPAAVGSDEPTAIRVRTPSTMDYVSSPMTGPSTADEARSSTVARP